MTIIEAINRIDVLKPNIYPQHEKIRWLSNLDGIIKTKLIDGHEGTENIQVEGYNDSTPPDTKLLVPPPFDDIYIRWLETWIDYYNGEYERYNNSVALYNDAYSEYESYYLRTHKGKRHRLKIL